jgi:hypothetical protein
MRGHVPEFLKAPVLLASVVSVYAATNWCSRNPAC